MLKNESARVPLTVIGILFVLISAAVSINISRIDSQMAASFALDDDIKTADTALLYAHADLARAINYAGMEAMKQMGETPVIEIDPTSQYSPGGDTPDVAEFNRNWAKGMIKHTLNQFIEANYMYNRYSYGEYAVNVAPLTDWKNIEISPIYMDLDRKLDPPLLAPTKTHMTYWKVTVPLNITIVDISSDDVVDEQNIIVGNLITCRYPLLKSLTSEYETRLNGANAVMTETTAFAMAYTWARGYLQYYKPKGPKNIVSNDHLALIVNGALLTDQGFVFNSVDPASIIEYAMQTKNTLSDKKDIDEAAFISNLSLTNGSFEIDPHADAANSTEDSANATQSMEQALQFDYNTTPITEYLNDNSLPGGSVVRRKIEDVIPQVYTTTFATGIDRQTSIEYGDHEGYEKSVIVQYPVVF